LPKRKKLNQREDSAQQELIKKLVIIGMFSDDDLLDRLVLKGGNAIDLLYRLGGRASIDVDFSISNDFSKAELAGIQGRIERTLRQTFREQGLEVFDFKLEERPRGLTLDMADFWGGYVVEFKLIDKKRYAELTGNIEALRRNALPLGRGTTFLIDISKHEYTIGKKNLDLDGYRVFVYTPEMIVCEKLRAICQQMPAYSTVVKRTRAGSSRARDFVDIYMLVTHRKIDLAAKQNRELLIHVFNAKRVPLTLLRQIATSEVREFHRLSYEAVRATVKPGVTLEAFDYYADYVVRLVKQLEPLGDE
jgi:predicted nucleotidyltransferase component of viral defense system